ncbi:MULTISPECIES: helix-turn-helix domain-containing protein [Gordonia]|uniref:helix-turn-helix domain-containing protein n=1 Tax=Gordonia TaxID=2053 RepID=UPI003570A84C
MRQRGLGVKRRVLILAEQLAAAGERSDTPTAAHDTELVGAQSNVDDLIGTEQAAQRLGCSPENVRALCRRGSLPAVRHAGRWMIPDTVVAERITERTSQQCRTSVSTSTARATTSLAVPQRPSLRLSS